MSKRILGVCLSFISLLLSACGTVIFSESSQPAKDRSFFTPTKPVEVKRKKTETNTIPPKIEKQKYGRFTVLVDENNNHTIVGGRFVPSKTLPHAPESWSRHVIFVNYQTKELTYYKKNSNDNYVPVVGYAVVTPSHTSLPKNVVRGVVSEIIKDPTWCPTNNIRLVLTDLPPRCLPPHHEKNAMGKVKFNILWRDVKGWEYNRIHGTKGYPRGNFLEAETFGCIRLENSAILELTEKLGEEAVKEGLEVIVYTP